VPIEVRCDGCGTRLRAPDTAAGKTKKCPKCGGALPIPDPSSTDDDADDLNLYELAIDPTPEPRDSAPDSVIIRRESTDRHAAEAPAAAGGSPYGAYAGAIAAEADKHRSEQKGPLLSVMGLDLTVGRLIGLGVLVVGLIFAGLWWTMFGPGRTHAVLAVQPVHVATAISRGELREPYSLLTMEGDMAVGIKGGESAGAAGAGSPATSIFKAAQGAVFSVGGDDQLLITREGKDGDHLLVELELSRALMNRLNQTAGYDVVFRGDQFELAPADGSPPRVKGRVIFAAFDGRADLDLAGATTTDHQAILPPGAPPTTEDIEKTGRKVTAGKLYYNGEAGIRGDLDFAVSYSPDAPAVRGGFAADGNLKLTDPGGAVVDLQYQGGELIVSWNAGSEGYWTRDKFTEPEGDNPFRKFKLGVLFERPYTDQPLRLTFAGKTLGTLPRRYNAEEPAGPSSGGVSGGVSGGGVLTYFSLLAQARDKARGTVADSNMVQIGYAIQMYADQNRGRLPDRLEDLRTVMPGIEAVLENKRTGENPGYVYIKPADTLGQVKDPADTVILYESKDGRIDPDGSKLYADGHIEQRAP